jgi:uncharacterized protein YidB (DUF937 family)
MTDKHLLFKAGLNQGMLAEKLGTKAPYVSNFLTGEGHLPRCDWQLIHEYFLELRCKDE